MTFNTAKLMIFTSLVSLQTLDATNAADRLSTASLKPLQALTFENGEEHGVTYFVHENNQCKVVLTVALKSGDDDMSSFAATRFETSIPGGKGSRFQTSSGKAIEFVCSADSQALTVRGEESIAGASK